MSDLYVMQVAIRMFKKMKNVLPNVFDPYFIQKGNIGYNNTRNLSKYFLFRFILSYWLLHASII